MFNWTFASFYSLSCALLPCVLLLIVRRQAALWTHHLWALHAATRSGGIWHSSSVPACANPLPATANPSSSWPALAVCSFSAIHSGFTS